MPVKGDVRGALMDARSATDLQIVCLTWVSWLELDFPQDAHEHNC